MFLTTTATHTDSVRATYGRHLHWNPVVAPIGRGLCLLLLSSRRLRCLLPSTASALRRCVSRKDPPNALLHKHLHAPFQSSPTSMPSYIVNANAATLHLLWRPLVDASPRMALPRFYRHFPRHLRPSSTCVPPVVYLPSGAPATPPPAIFYMVTLLVPFREGRMPPLISIETPVLPMTVSCRRTP